MIFNEKFCECNQPYNPVFHIRLAGELFPDKNYCIERTDSKTATIMFITSGILKLKYDNKNLSLRCGDSIIFPPHIQYRIKADPKHPPTALWVNIRGSLFESTYNALFPDKKFAICACSIEKELRQIFDMVESVPNFEDLTSLCIKIMLKMYSIPTTNNKVKYNKETLTGQLEAYIAGHVQEEFSIQDMCAHFNMSKEKLSRIFKNDLHTTPYNYYQNLRFDVAKSLLINSNLSIDEIADRLTFTDRNYFTLCFKKYVGITPAKYRSMYEVQ